MNKEWNFLNNEKLSDGEILDTALGFIKEKDNIEEFKEYYHNDYPVMTEVMIQKKLQETVGERFEDISHLDSFLLGRGLVGIEVFKDSDYNFEDIKTDKRLWSSFKFGETFNEQMKIYFYYIKDNKGELYITEAFLINIEEVSND